MPASQAAFDVMALSHVLVRQSKEPVLIRSFSGVSALQAKDAQ
jgi:hypothetical protein